MRLSINKLFQASSTTLRYTFISQERSTVGALVHTAAVLCFIWPKAVMNMNSGACWCHKKAEECSGFATRGEKGNAATGVLLSIKNKIRVKQPPVLPIPFVGCKMQAGGSVVLGARSAEGEVQLSPRHPSTFITRSQPFPPPKRRYQTYLPKTVPHHTINRTPPSINRTFPRLLFSPPTPLISPPSN